MQWLNEEKLMKSPWYGGGNGYLDIFRGEVQEGLVIINEDIITILDSEADRVDMFIGKNIKLFFDFLKNHDYLKRFIEEFPDIEKKFYLLNKVRVFTAHGNSYTNGKIVILLKEHKRKEEGLIFNDNLVKEVKDLISECSIFVLNVQMELGYFDTETEESRYFTE